MRVANDYHQAIQLEDGTIIPASPASKGGKGKKGGVARKSTTSVKEVAGLSEKDIARHMSGKGKHRRRRLRILPDAPATSGPGATVQAQSPAGPVIGAAGPGAGAPGGAGLASEGPVTAEVTKGGVKRTI
ncbi:MAG TPA: hypothetical protein VI756_32585 [Blastocatellia bacterium]